MEKPEKEEPKKKGLFAILKESMLKTGEGCGPGCGCHIEEDPARKQRGNVTQDNSRK